MSISKTLVLSETTPLLLHPNRSHVVAATLHDKQCAALSYSVGSPPVESSLDPVGPLEISTSTRRLIITGAWLGTFLAVSNTLFSSVSAIMFNMLSAPKSLNCKQNVETKTSLC